MPRKLISVTCPTCDRQFTTTHRTTVFCGRHCASLAITDEEALFQHVSKTETCWIWTGGLTDKGYGKVFRKGRYVPAHCLSYAIHTGPLDENLVIDHLCRNHACVNPKHLEQVTSGINTLRGFGPPANNARKTHCPKGHPYDEENTLLHKKRTGRLNRACRICWNAASERSRRKAAIPKRVYKSPDQLWRNSL